MERAGFGQEHSEQNLVAAGISQSHELQRRLGDSATGHDHQAKKQAKAAIESDGVASTSQSRLLELSGELRNRIYRYALVKPPYPWPSPPGYDATLEDHNEHITEEYYGQPALLRTCTQIRAEASTIYYHENHFLLSPENYDCTPALSFLQHAKHHLKIGKARNLDWTGCFQQGSWSSLLKWLRCTHEGLLPYGHDGVFGPDDNMHPVMLLEIVAALEGVPWEKVEKTLIIYREGIALDGHMMP